MNFQSAASFDLFLTAANAAAFAAFFIDKRRAENDGRRISEKTLLALAFYGGSLGALIGQQALRHKTSKQPFRARLCAIAFFHVVSATIWLVPALRKVLMGIAASI